MRAHSWFFVKQKLIFNFTFRRLVSVQGIIAVGEFFFPVQIVFYFNIAE